MPPSASPSAVYLPTTSPFTPQSLKNSSTQFTSSPSVFTFSSHHLCEFDRGTSHTWNIHSKRWPPLCLDFISSNKCFSYIHHVSLLWIYPEPYIDLHLLYFQLIFKKSSLEYVFIDIFKREREEGRERERGRETSIGCLLITPQLGIEPTT